MLFWWIEIKKQYCGHFSNQEWSSASSPSLWQSTYHFFFVFLITRYHEKVLIVEDTFKSVPQLRLEVPARIERHRFSQQRRLSCNSNWGTNPIKTLKGTSLSVEPTLCWYQLPLWCVVSLHFCSTFFTWVKF